MALPKDFLSNPFVYAEKAPIPELQKIIVTLSEAYELTGKTYVEDKVYDQLLVILEERDPSNSVLGKVGAKTKKSVKLPYYASSLDKIKPDSDAISSWKRQYRGPYLISDKLDGISCILEAKPFGFKLYTRGDGRYGSDITQLEQFIGLPRVKLDEGVVIRGELIISKKNFEKIKGVMANARNAVAGTANSKKINKDVASLIEFIAYNIQTDGTSDKGKLTNIQQFEALQSLGFKVPTHVVVTDISNETLSDYLVKRRRDSLYEIDGLVVSDSSKVYEIEEGKNPDYEFSFKNVLTNETAEVQVREVLWRVSKTGYIKPTVRISPVRLSGVTITFATAFNAKYICDNIIGPGSILEIVRSGDVIPHILKIVEPSATGKPQLPNLNYVWTSTEVDIVFVDEPGRGKGCYNEERERELEEETLDLDESTGQEKAALQMKTQKIVHFFTTLGIKGIAEKTVQKFIENGVDTVVKILTMDSRNLTSIEGIGKILVDKIRDNSFKQLDAADLPTLMDSCSCFGRGIGKKKLAAVLVAVPNLLEIKSDRNEMIRKIKDIPGFDTKTATLVVDGIGNFKTFYAALAGAGISMRNSTASPIKPKRSDKFKGETVVFTGVRDKDLEKFIEENGGKIGSTVSGSTTILIHADNAKMTVKLSKAVEKGVKLYSISDFKKKYLTAAKEEATPDYDESDISFDDDDDDYCSKFINETM